jgi:hypothetical protein
MLTPTQHVLSHAGSNVTMSLTCNDCIGNDERGTVLAPHLHVARRHPARHCLQRDTITRGSDCSIVTVEGERKQKGEEKNNERKKRRRSPALTPRHDPLPPAAARRQLQDDG